MSESVMIWGGIVVVSAVVFGYYLKQFTRRARADEARQASARQAGIDKAVSQHPHIDELSCIGCGSCVDACPEGDVLGIVSGVAVLINGLRCVGHGRCAEVCPVGAIQIGLGDISARTDLPILGRGQETTVPGVFVAGELSGFSLIRNAITQGTQVAEHIAAHRPRSTDPDTLDVVIVGAGPAGLSAALAAKRAGLRCVVLDQQGVGGTILQYPRRKLVLTQPVELPLYGMLHSSEYTKEQLIDIWSEVPERFGLDVRIGSRVVGVERMPVGFRIASEKGESVDAMSVILALGRRGSPRKLEVPGEAQAKVLYQLLDAKSYGGRRVLVVGGGDSAVEAAMALAKQSGTQVTISYRKDQFARIKKRNQDRLDPLLAAGRIKPLYSSQVLAIGSDRVRLAVPEGELDLPNDDVFVLIGGDPPYPFLRGIGIRFGGEGADSAERGAVAHA
ncbi:MAG: NAD(P)-binding domain-containing protein [Candidatus Eisenbacteria bacterium]